MNSSLSRGQVRHSRCRPRRQAFRYRPFQFYRHLDELPEVLFDDYRDLTGRYDRIVSVAMIEAVGHQCMAGNFAQCSRLLKTGGAGPGIFGGIHASVAVLSLLQRGRISGKAPGVGAATADQARCPPHRRLLPIRGRKS